MYTYHEKYRVSKRYVATFFIVLLILGVPSVFLNNLKEGTHINASPVKLNPIVIGPSWVGPAAYDESWMPQMVGVDFTKELIYKGRDKKSVILYIGYYRDEKQGKELINSTNSLYDNKHWQLYHPEETSRTINLPINETLLRSDDEHYLLVWSWYRIAGKNTASNVIAKMLSAWSVISYTKGSAIIAIATRYNGDLKKARIILNDFRESSLNSINSAIDSIK